MPMAYVKDSGIQSRDTKNVINPGIIMDYEAFLACNSRKRGDLRVCEE